MKQTTEQAIISISGTATKVSGTATAASGTVGWLAFMLDHQQIFLLLFAFIGVVITLITAAINASYQKKRDERDHEKHLIEIAIDEYKLEKLKEESEQRRRETDL